MFKGKKYYGEFLKSDEKISTNILANRLEKLEAEGLITKKIDETNNAKKVYSLTRKGIDLLPMLLETIAWAAKYDSETATPAAFIKQLKENREALISELTANLSDCKK